MNKQTFCCSLVARFSILCVCVYRSAPAQCWFSIQVFVILAAPSAHLEKCWSWNPLLCYIHLAGACSSTIDLVLYTTQRYIVWQRAFFFWRRRTDTESNVRQQYMTLVMCKDGCWGWGGCWAYNLCWSLPSDSNLPWIYHSASLPNTVCIIY